MSLPRLRFTVRGMMVAVAVVAVLMSEWGHEQMGPPTFWLRRTVGGPIRPPSVPTSPSISLERACKADRSGCSLHAPALMLLTRSYPARPRSSETTPAGISYGVPGTPGSCDFCEASLGFRLAVLVLQSVGHLAFRASASRKFLDSDATHL